MSISNIVVRNSMWVEADLELLFGDQEVQFVDSNDMSKLMAEIGAFDSTSQARKAGRVGPIPPGFTFEFKANKKRRIWIWNPTEGPTTIDDTE